MDVMQWVLLITLCLIIIAVYETFICFLRKVKRRRIYQMAYARSKETGLPLLVVGDPYNGIASKSTGADYGCGDVCLDLTGCPGCASRHVKILKGSMEELLPVIDLSKYIVYISCVLEYVNDLPVFLESLKQVRKGNLFIVNVERYSLVAYIYPYYLTNEQPPKYIIRTCPPFSSAVQYSETGYSGW